MSQTSHRTLLIESMTRLRTHVPFDAMAQADLQPLQTALDDIPALALSEVDAARLLHGQPVHLNGRPMGVTSGDVVLAMRDDVPVALAHFTGTSLEPRRVFNL